MYSWRQVFAAFMTVAIFAAIAIAFGRLEQEDYKSFFLIIGAVSIIILVAYLIKRRNGKAHKPN